MKISTAFDCACFTRLLLTPACSDSKDGQISAQIVQDVTHTGTGEVLMACPSPVHS
jgi:hypothetical protein